MEITRASRPPRILVVDDHEPTRTLLRRLLSTEGYQVDEAPDGPTALAKVKQAPPDMLLLDIMMPGQDGIDLLAQVRRTSRVPVILLSAKSGEGDRVLGLRSGADDYVVKPFSTAELTARIEAVLRRAHHVSGGDGRDFGDLQVDPGCHQVTVRGRLVDLPQREFDLLVCLTSAPGHVFSRTQLLAEVWQSSVERQDPATVTEHARRLRQRIEDDPDSPRWIKTVRGVGYRFDP
jgi:DNA-binding response OmpR family regulator